VPSGFARPTTPQRPPSLPKRHAREQYPADPASRYETAMLAYALGFYGCYAAAIAGAVPMWAGGAVGVLCLLRYFNQAHAMMHADVRRERRWHPARWVLIIMGPLYLGYRELRASHLLHHREEGSGRDPDVLMMCESPFKAALWCLLQPELTTIDYFRQFRWRGRAVVGLGLQCAAYGGLMWLGGWPGLVLYNVMTRVGNGLAFFVFAWVVHTPWLWGQVRPPRMPALLAQIWVVLIGWDNLVATRFHFLHHVFPHIPDRCLPEVSRRLAYD